MASKSVEEVRRTIQGLYEEWFRQVVSGSWGFFAAVLADDWVYINFHGEVRSKNEYREYIKDVPPDRAPAAPRDLQVRLFGDLAIVHGTYLASGGRNDVDRVLRFTAIWVYRGGRWQSLTHHTTVVTHPA